MKRFALALAALALTSFADAQPPAVYTWHTFADDASQLGLTLNGRQVGGYDLERGAYREYLGNDRWGEYTTCPVALPGWAQAREREYQRARPNFGIDTGRLRQSQTDSLNGRPATTGEVLRALGAPICNAAGKAQTVPQPEAGADPPTDKDALCVTVIGDDAFRKRVLSDLDTAPALAAYKGKVRVQDYAPTDWAVTTGGFQATEPTVYVQLPDGRVPARVRAYTGPDQLAEALACAVRRKDPNYDPAKDPDLSCKPPKTDPLSVPDDQSHAALATALNGGALGIYALLKARKR